MERSVSADIGILGFGAYVPRLRLQRASVFENVGWFNPGLKGLAKGERAAANWDEDPITMAVEAARDCLADRDRGEVCRLFMASTTLPNADRLNSGIVKEALNLSDEVGASDFAGSQRAGTSALMQVLDAAAGVDGAILCVAAERRKARPASEAELLQGDAAAAVLIGKGEPIARYLGSTSLTIDFVDHFRATGRDFDYGWESRWVRDEGYAKIAPDALKQALRKLSLSADKVAHLIIPMIERGVAEQVAKKAGFAADIVADTLSAKVGSAGAAHPLLLLAHVLETAKPGEIVLLVGFGQGCDVLAFEVGGAGTASNKAKGVSGWLARRKPETNYTKFLFFRNLIDLDTGMRAEMDQKQPLTALYRNRKAVLGLVGGRCTKTGTVQFPRSDISVNPNDHAVGTQEDYPFAERRARILTYTADSLTFSPDPPQYYGMIEFDEGGRMMAEIVDADAEEVAVGAPLKMMFRIKSIDEDRGFTKYFWKAVPAF